MLIKFGLAQCYGDLSLLDCVLCYTEAQTLLPQCSDVLFITEVEFTLTAALRGLRILHF